MDFKADSTKSEMTNDIITLYLGEDSSIFQNDKKAKIDSIINSQLSFQMPSRPMFKVSHIIHKNYVKNEQIYSDKIESVNFGYKENNPPMEWKLVNEEKELLSHKCYKAITSFRGRNFIAWYTKNIPINDGPYKFSGLPGLILEVYDDNENFHYYPLAIVNKSQDVLYDKDIKMIEREQMIQARINLIKKHVKGNIKVNPLERK